MSLRTVMQAGPAKANELFARLLDTSDGAVKTREKLFTELKTELELHTNLEEQHLFPVLRRNAETKGLVPDAIKDNRELRAKLAELEALPKNDEAFPERLKELQKTFRQHARDEKRELLPAVQRALSEEQAQGVAEKIEAGVAEAEQARQDELDERRLKARQAQEEAERRVHDAAEVVTRAATAAQTSVLRVAKGATTSTQRIGTEVLGVTDTYMEALSALPGVAVSAMTEARSAWIEWMSQTMRVGARISQELMLQSAEQQRRFVADAAQRWMEHNARILQITNQAAQEGFLLSANRSAGSDTRQKVQ